MNADTRPRVGRNLSVTMNKGGGPERVAVETPPDDWTPPAPIGFAPPAQTTRRDVDPLRWEGDDS